jgi:hypothetical protein
MAVTTTRSAPLRTAAAGDLLELRTEVGHRKSATRLTFSMMTSITFRSPCWSAAAGNRRQSRSSRRRPLMGRRRRPPRHRPERRRRGDACRRHRGNQRCEVPAARHRHPVQPLGRHRQGARERRASPTGPDVALPKVGEVPLPGVEAVRPLEVIDIGIPPGALAAVQPRLRLLEAPPARGAAGDHGAGSRRSAACCRARMRTGGRSATSS